MEWARDSRGAKEPLDEQGRCLSLYATAAASPAEKPLWVLSKSINSRAVLPEGPH